MNPFKILLKLRRLKDPHIKLFFLALASLCCAIVSVAAEEDSYVDDNFTQTEILYHSVDEETDLHEEIKILKLQIGNLFNLTKNLSCQLEKHINHVQTDKCGSKPCQNGGVCHSGDNNSFTCTCPSGFTDVNRCRYPGTCGSPSDAGNCHRCRDGFVKDPEDDTRCKYANGNSSLIISSRADIRMISLDGLNTTLIILKNDHVQSTDYSLQANKIFWFSAVDGKIYTAPIHKETETKRSLHESSMTIFGVAVDWMHEHLYWGNIERGQITVANLNGTMKKVLFNDRFSAPTSIAVNPLNGWMYWVDQRQNRIERAGLDGSRREVILQTNIKYPHGLVVDFEDSRLYWSQGVDPSSIWSCEIDGSDPKLIFTPNPFQITDSNFWKISTYDKYVYFIEWNNKAIYKVNKCHGDELEMIYKSESDLYDIKTYDATQQPQGENLCSKQRGCCSHFCFPVPSIGNGSVSMTTCACPDGLSLSDDQQNCF